MPGKCANASRASAAATFVSVSALTEIECVVNTGTRTVVGEIGKSGWSRIFLISLTSLISSSVYPPSTNFPAGIRLNAIGRGKNFASTGSPFDHAVVCSRSSAIPFTPAPDTAWKLVATTRRSRPRSWIGLSGITVTIVVQFGHATIPLCRRAAAPFISGTTSGTSGSIRNALDLSTTIAPALTAIGANSRDWSAPAENSAISMPWNELASSFSMVIVSPAKVPVLPADRADAYARSSRTGNLRCSRIFRVVWPTAPVAPTTAIRCPLAIARFYIDAVVGVNSRPVFRPDILKPARWAYLRSADGLGHAVEDDHSLAAAARRKRL